MAKSPNHNINSNFLSPARLAFLFLIPFWVYFSTESPTIYSEDSPEIITAGFTLGIAHPPSYPLHTLAMHFAFYAPVGNLAFRGNLFSAVLAACGAVLMSVNLWLLLGPYFLLKPRRGYRLFLLNVTCGLGGMLLAF